MEQSTLSDFHWCLDPEKVGELLSNLGFRADSVELLKRASRDVAADSVVSKQFPEFCQQWLSGELPSLPVSLWEALAVVAAFPAVIQFHRSKGIPESVTSETLLDLEGRIDDHRQRTGCDGFSALRWMRNHVTGKLFQVGRLQYNVGPFGYVHTVYRDAASGDVVTLAFPDLACDQYGWPYKDATAFVTSIRRENGQIIGHPTSADTGAISKKPVAISEDSEILLDGSHTILNVHIPAGKKLDRAACVASMHAAGAFFDRHFPEVAWSGICCLTWLLDRELERVLPPGSNITEFGRLFTPLSVREANGDQHIERVFGLGRTWQEFTGPNALPVTTSLQKAILYHLENGGILRRTGGYILRGDLPI